MRRIAGTLLVLVLIVALSAAAVLLARREWRAPGPLPAATNIVVPRGDTADVAAALKHGGVIGATLPFRLAARLTAGAGALHAAELRFPAHASLRYVLAVLRLGKPVQHELTIPEGLTAAQIAEVVAHAPFLVGSTPVAQEGAVLPQTYDYERGESREALVARAERAMRRALAAAWVNRAPGLPLVSSAQLVVLASMVERETAVPAERALVAAVFINRLRLGMKLQSDPTVIYGATGGLGPLARPLSRADLLHDDPYNTYVAPGLPPAPICSPGLAALQAAAHPATTDDLYFVADGHGGHTFSATLRQHDVNVARYRTFLSEAVGVPGSAAAPKQAP